jgi:hypothetical protein
MSTFASAQKTSRPTAIANKHQSRTLVSAGRSYLLNQHIPWLLLAACNGLSCSRCGGHSKGEALSTYSAIVGTTVRST